LLSEAANQGDKFFDCTVQVLKTQSDSNGNSFIWVTDFTQHDYFLTPSKSWGDPATMDHCVVKVQMRDTQAEQVENLVSGAYYRIRKLRLKKVFGTDQLAGNLGGTERLIIKLREDGTKPELRALVEWVWHRRFRLGEADTIIPQEEGCS
jgi:hypothetical protein